MKKLTLFATALAAIFFAASCQEQEMIEPVAQETAVTYTVELPGVETKAIADGKNVDQLIYEVWKTEAADERDLTEGKAVRLYQRNDVPLVFNSEGVKSAVISLNLVQDQEYTVLFWAQVKDNGVYNTEDLTSVQYVKDEEGNLVNLLSNQESYAAFYGIDFVSDEDPKSKKVILKRPFAQLNLATKNTADEYTVEVLSSKVTIDNVGIVFNVAQNYVSAPATETTPARDAQIAVGSPAVLTFDTATDPSGDDEKITVNGQEYEYVAMNYLFATGNTVKVTYEIDAKLTGKDHAGNATTVKAKVTNTVNNVPLQENYRTNIVGNLLTSTTDYEVVVDASWDDVNDENLNGDGYLVEVWDQKYIQEPYYNETLQQYEISLASELAWLAAAVNGNIPATKADTEPAQTFSGKKFVLKEDIDLDGALWNPIGSNGGKFMGTFDGNGKTISNLTVATEGKASAGLFGTTRSATITNVTVVNATITGHYKTGVIVGDGLCAKIENCHVEGATVTVTPFDKDDANNVGGIVGYLAADGGTAYAKDCSVKDADISAYRKVAGLVGAANGAAVVSGKTLGTVTVTADMTQPYNSVETAYAGPYVGYKNDAATVTIEEGSATPSVKVLMDSAAELNAGSGNSKEIVHVFVSEGTINFEENQPVTVYGAIQTNPGETVTLNVANNNIVAGTPTDYGFIATEGSTLVINDANIESKGGAIGVDSGAKVTFNSGSVNVNSSSTSGRYNFYVVGEGTEVTINGGEFSFDPKKNQKRSYVYVGAGAKVYITGGTFGKASTRDGYPGIKGDGTVIITGGTFGFNPSKWVAEGYTALKEGTTWKVVSQQVSDKETLADRLTANEENIAVVLTEDLDLPISSLGQQTSGSGEYKLGGENTKSITIDLNGKKLNITTTYWSSLGAKNADAVFTIKNGTMTSSQATGTWNSYDLTFANCEYVIENVVFDKAIAFTNAGKAVSLNNVTINETHDYYAMWVSAKGQKLDIDGLTINSDGRGIKIDEEYVDTPAKVTMDIKNATFKTAKKAAILVKSVAGAEINASNLDITKVAADPAFAVWVDEDAAAYADKVVVTGAMKKVEGDYAAGVGASTAEAVSEAIKEGATKIYLAEGTYVIPDDAKGKTLTFIGTGAPEDTQIATQDDGSYEGCDYSLDGSTVTFENISINTNSATYTGYARCNGTYKNCVINGTYTLYGNSVFENCTFNVSGDVYNIWTWGAPEATFTNCTFTCDGKAMLLYGTANTKLTMNNCIFNDNGGLSDLKAAIEIGNDYGKSYELIVNNATVNGFEINDKGINTGTTLWANKNSMDQDKLNVVVDGVDVY